MSQVNNLKMLRILVVENSNMASQSFYSRSLMQFIGNLIHLRCLSLRGCTDLTLPYSLGNLKYVETLDLSDSECSTIPDVLWKLGRLMHLYLPYCHSNRKLQLDGLGMSLEILGSFHSRFCLPRDLSKLTNILRALKAIVHENLEDLEQFINHLSNLNHLRVSSLTIKVHDFGINSNRQKDGLKSLTILKELKLLTMPREFINRVEVVNGEQGPDYDKISHVASDEIR
ncbi:probable disease resistance protein At1g58390 [Coffea eugenioides]|uniref:probable disease resistance protein At1g58390 n=1 Tax=Coffea eugenioides TaxID=49369 RepID=UPI000F612B68|nr:probable disease resistance protein At1g58390 [Coffea eugenioides]